MWGLLPPESGERPSHRPQNGGERTGGLARGAVFPPAEGENCRGYLMYEVKALVEMVICWTPI